MQTDEEAATTATATVTTMPTVILAQPRDPGTFTGTDNLDVEDWLRLYERVSENNRWDQTVMLANLIFYLKGTAGAWFQTHEEELTSWEQCKKKLRDLFGRTVGRQRAAKKELGTRAQTSTESYVTYIQDVLALCRKVDERMPEEEKVNHVLKGIADDAFNLLVYKNCTSIDDIISECRRFEEAKGRRIVHQYTRLPNTAATSSCEDHSAPQPTTSESIVRIVRREIEAASPVNSPTYAPNEFRPTVSLIQSVVREELANLGVPSVCPINRSDAFTTVPAPRNQYPSRPYRNPMEWRTPDDRPICFNCRRVGHISRHCRNTWTPSFRPAFQSYHRSPGSRSPPEQPTEPCHRAEAPPPTRQSRSPSPRRPLPRPATLRRSPSPMYRRSSEN